MKKLLIVDGHALLFQSFFGMPNKIKNSNGNYIEAVICFTGILLKVIKAIQPTELLIIFDGENKLTRQELDENYKANRQDYTNALEEDNPFAQLNYIKQVLNYLQFAWHETSTCEADDLIASIANQEKSNKEIIIFSPDKDFYQLISTNVSVFHYRGKLSKFMNEQEIKNKCGFDPKHFSTFKSLVGDKSDNIKGVNGIGEKTATALIQQYGNLNTILTNLNNLPEKISTKLLNEKEKVLNNYKIIDLSNVKIPITFNNLKFKSPNLTTNQILKALNLI